MSIIIRLQNLPWSANSVDIRRFFSGLSIPEGGVHIVGGEMGDAFIAFSTDEDARLAMAKDGGKIKDMQIKLLLSSRTEMTRVIEQARQQNMVSQSHVLPPQPPMLSIPQSSRMALPVSDDRRRERSPSPHRRSRDRSPVRDRRRSPDERRSKRNRSRSPSRSSRESSRDIDRRDRFQRDSRRYDDRRFRDDRRSSRNSPLDSKKYIESDSGSERSQTVDGYRDIHGGYSQEANISGNLFSYADHSQVPSKSFSSTSQTLSESTARLPQMDKKAIEIQPLATHQNILYSHEQLPFRPSHMESAVPSKDNAGLPINEMQKSRRSRFDSEFPAPVSEPHYIDSSRSEKSLTESPRESSYNGGRPLVNFSSNRDSWQQERTQVSDKQQWSDQRSGMLNVPSKNEDFVQVVPMDLDPSPSEMQEKEIYQENIRGPSFIRNNSSPRTDEMRDFSTRVPVCNEPDLGQSLTVEVRGLPPDARIDDILDLFQGIPLPAANIRIQANDQGFEKAYIRFVSASDLQEALNRNRRFRTEGRCELVHCTATAFDNAPRPQKPRPKPREEDLTVQIRGLPFSCKEDDLVQFFDGLGILDLYIEYNQDGRASGIGFVEFGTPEDFNAALIRNGKTLGRRFLTVSVASKEMMAVARGHPYNAHAKDSRFRPSRPSQTPVNSNRPAPNSVSDNMPQSNQFRPAAPHCISLKGLPERVTNRDIADFLGQVQVAPRAIHIMLKPDETPSGDAYAEFASVREMEAALEMNGKMVMRNRVSVQPISFQQMSEILGRPAVVPPVPGSPALLRTPGDIERPRRPLLDRSRMEQPVRGRPYEPFKRMERPPFNRMRGPRPNRPPFKPERYSHPPADRAPKDFGAPGCVVGINNLHFRAGLEELLDFFQDYNISKDNIIRKYNENGQTTGEARVAFQTPSDAQRAVRELNKRQIMGRTLSLCLV